MSGSSDQPDRDYLDDLARRAREDADEPDPDQDVDLVEALRAQEDEGEAGGEPPDLTLLGYIERHDRPPAFTGADDQPYTVDVDVEATEDGEAPFAAFFVFVRWAATGAGIMGHVESGNVAYGDTEDEARQAAFDLTLYDVKEALDAAIERRRRELED